MRNSLPGVVSHHYSLGLSVFNKIVPKRTSSYWSEHVLWTPASEFNCAGHPTGGVPQQPHPAPGGLASAHLTAHTTTTRLPRLLGQLLAELIGGYTWVPHPYAVEGQVKEEALIQLFTWNASSTPPEALIKPTELWILLLPKPLAVMNALCVLTAER